MTASRAGSRIEVRAGAMKFIPTSNDTPLIRTDFSDERAWRDVARAAVAESEEGFRAHLSLCDDRAFEAAKPEQLAQSPADVARHACLFVADAMTITHDEHPLLCVDLLSPGRSFRVVPGAHWGVENNLAVANMDFEDFADAVDEDGIFRDFR
jgi:hypothetical protein